jgi:hypothetical protein
MTPAHSSAEGLPGISASFAFANLPAPMRVSWRLIVQFQ